MISFKVLAMVCLAGCGIRAEDFDYTSSSYKSPPPMIIHHKQALSKDGNFNFVFTSENGLKQGETIRPDGTRQGGYSYVDPDGKTVTVKYIAGKDGFRILEGDVPKAPELSPSHEQIVNQHQQIRQQLRDSARDAYDKPLRPSYEQPARNPFETPLRPSYDQPRSTFDQQRPAYEQQRPAYEQQRPAYEQQRPAYDQPRSSFEQQRPSFEQQRPAYEQQRPSFEQPQRHGYQQPARNSLDRSAGPAKPNYRVQEAASQYRDEHKGPHSYGSGYSFEFSG